MIHQSSGRWFSRQNVRLALTVALAFLGLCSSPAFGSAYDLTEPVSSDPFLAIDTYRLWSGRAAGAQGDGIDETPTISRFRLQPGLANGAAVIVAPGGAYLGHASALEGRQVADWFAARGVTAFVLRYRTGAKSRLPVPFSDGHRAIQFVRANAMKFGIDADRIGFVGFSAGGHLGATIAATAVEGDPDAADTIDRVSSRPDFLILAYPWLEGTVIEADGMSPYCRFARDFAKASCRSEEFVKYQPLLLAHGAMPPTFIFHTASDGIAPVGASVRFYQALLAHKVPAELHVFEKGEHGAGLGGSDPVLSQWTNLLDHWLRNYDFFKPKQRTGSAAPAPVR